MKVVKIRFSDQELETLNQLFGMMMNYYRTVDLARLKTDKRVHMIALNEFMFKKRLELYRKLETRRAKYNVTFSSIDILFYYEFAQGIEPLIKDQWVNCLARKILSEIDRQTI